MTDEKLDSFRIGDTRKPFVSAPKKAESIGLSEPPTIGFKRIEGMLERESAGDALGRLADLTRRLEEFSAQAVANRDKAAAKKAISGVNRVTELVDFLYKTKASMGGKDPT